MPLVLFVRIQTYCLKSAQLLYFSVQHLHPRQVFQNEVQAQWDTVQSASSELCDLGQVG